MSTLLLTLQQKIEADNALAKATAMESARRAEEGRQRAEIEAREYADKHFDEFIEYISHKCLECADKGTISIYYGSPIFRQDAAYFPVYFKVYTMLEQKFEEIRNWAISQGLQVIAERSTVIATEWDRDHEGGTIDGTDRPVYGPKITLSWPTAT